MKNIEVVPGDRVIGRVEASSIAMPGQLRIPQDIAIEKHIAQFWNPQNHGEIPSHAELRENAIHHVAKGIGVDYEVIKNYTWAQHNLIWELHEHGNNGAARIIAEDINLTSSEPIIHKLLVKTAAILVYTGQDEYGHEGLDEHELESAVKQIDKINDRKPADDQRWQRKWRQEMKGLARYRNEIRLWGETGTISYWYIKTSK